MNWLRKRAVLISLKYSLTPRYRRDIIVFRNLQTPERTKEELTGIQCVTQTHLPIRPIRRTNTTHGLCLQGRQCRESVFVFSVFCCQNHLDPAIRRQ